MAAAYRTYGRGLGSTLDASFVYENRGPTQTVYVDTTYANTVYADTITGRTTASTVVIGGVTISSGTVDGVDVSALPSFPAALASLTTAEVNQLLNINTTTISTATWGYLGALDQSVATSASPTFANVTATTALLTDTISERTGGAGVTIDGVLVLSGTVDGLDVSTLPANLSSLTSAEVTQLLNIDTTTINAGQWAWLGALDQALATTDSVTFANVSTSGTLSADTISELTPAAGVTVEGVTFSSGTVGGHDLSTWPSNLATLTTSEVTQLANIGATTISAAQWGYVAAMDQTVASGSNVTFGTTNYTNYATAQATVSSLTATTGSLLKISFTTGSSTLSNITLGTYDSVADHGFTVPVTGFYRVTANANQSTAGATTALRTIMVKQSGADGPSQSVTILASNISLLNIGTLLYCETGTSDVIHFTYQQASGSDGTLAVTVSIVYQGE